jgi:uncharacterized protein (TIGR02588 family)
MNIPKKNRLEWSVFAASTIIVLAALGYLGVSALRAEKTPPDLRLLVGTPGRHAGVHRVPILVRNIGESTAESVLIEVVLRRGEEEVERAELDLAFVPRKSEREGWVTFRNDPRCCAMVTRAVGYETP